MLSFFAREDKWTLPIFDSSLLFFKKKFFVFTFRKIPCVTQDFSQLWVAIPLHWNHRELQDPLGSTENLFLNFFQKHSWRLGPHIQNRKLLLEKEYLLKRMALNLLLSGFYQPLSTGVCVYLCVYTPPVHFCLPRWWLLCDSQVSLNSLPRAMTTVFNDSVSVMALLVATEPWKVGLRGWTFAHLCDSLSSLPFWGKIAVGGYKLYLSPPVCLMLCGLGIPKSLKSRS